MARNRLIERTLIDLASRALYATYRFIEWRARVSRRRPTGICTPISAASGKTDNHGFRIEEYEPANRACPSCPERWIGPGTMEYMSIESCARCRAVEKKPKYVKVTAPRRDGRRRKFVSRSGRPCAT